MKLKGHVKKSSINKYHQMTQRVNRLLIKDPKTWRGRLIILFNRVAIQLPYRDEEKNMTLLKILNQLQKSYELPFDVVQLVWAQLVKMNMMEAVIDPQITKQAWHYQMGVALEAYKDQMIKAIRALNPGE